MTNGNLFGIEGLSVKAIADAGSSIVVACLLAFMVYYGATRFESLADKMVDIQERQTIIAEQMLELDVDNTQYMKTFSEAATERNEFLSGILDRMVAVLETLEEG